MHDCNKKSNPEQRVVPDGEVKAGAKKDIPVLSKPIPPTHPVAPQFVVPSAPVTPKKHSVIKDVANAGEKKAQDKTPPPADSKKSSSKWVAPFAVCCGLSLLGLGGWLVYDLMLSSHHTLPTQNEPSTSVMAPAPAEKSHDSAVADASSELAVESVMPSAPIPEPTPEERYNNGANAPSEPIAAIAWHKEFSDQGIVDATYQLGLSYYNARSIPLNFEKAVEAFKKAAEQGHQEAAAKLAECYEWGVGVDASAEEAAKWRPAGKAASDLIGDPAEPVETDNGMVAIGNVGSTSSLHEQPTLSDSRAASSYNAAADDRSSLDPLIARMRALRCRHATSALYQKRLLTLLPLIRNGAHVDITLPETKGNTALHYACAIGSLSITRWLLENGANPNAVTNKGATPLMCVGSDNRAAIIQALRAYGAVR